MAKSALCVGINNYPGTDSDLSGCVNDAKAWADVLKSRGYAPTVLLDDQATRKGMVNALTTLVTGAKSGDTVVFTYSGHGSWLPDDNGDESDGRDEMLCPHDIDSGQYLMDDDLHLIFSSKASNVRIVFISDSCHSGSVFKFAPPVGNGKRPQVRFLPPDRFVKSPAERAKLRAAVLKPARRKSETFPALLAAGCTDVQFSYDAWFADVPHGAFTYFALQELKKNPPSPATWMDAIRTHLPTSQYPQSPQLRGSRTERTGGMF